MTQIWCRWMEKDSFRQAQATELPARGGREEIPVGGADVGRGGDTGASAEDDLRGHELAVVLAEGAGKRFVAGISGVGGSGPLPYVAVHLLEAVEYAVATFLH